MKDDGTCPACGEQIEAAHEHGGDADDDLKAPWHFKLMVVALIIYLGWRLVDIFV